MVDYGYYGITVKKVAWVKVTSLLHHEDGVLAKLLRSGQALQHLIFHNDQYQLHSYRIDSLSFYKLLAFRAGSPGRPLRFTFNSCTLKATGKNWTLLYWSGHLGITPYSALLYRCRNYRGHYFALCPEFYCGVVKLSTFTCDEPSQAAMLDHILSNITMHCLPNYTEQLDWLAKFRETLYPTYVVTGEREFFSDEWRMLDDRQKCLHAIAGEIVKAFKNTERNGKSPMFFRSIEDFFQLYMAISFIARRIADGEVDFPPPPQPVPLCPLHTQSTVCPCLPASSLGWFRSVDTYGSVWPSY